MDPLVSRLPDFFIIGAMKAATSSLHSQLAALDGVHMSTPKELYYFSDDPIFEKGLEWYSAHFDDAEEDDLCGESSTHYSKLPTYPDTIERIRQYVPDARFIYIMRHPIDRLESQYKHMWFQRETTAGFAEAVDGAVPELVDYSRYSMQLEPYLRTFGAERVLPLFVDGMRAEPDQTIGRVAEHIGLDGEHHWNHDLGARNVSAERLQHSDLRDTIKSLPGYEKIRSLVPEATLERVRARWRPDERPELTSTQRERLVRIFDQDLATLGSWLDLPLQVANFRTATQGSVPAWTESVLNRYPVPERTESA